jgi:hypothetical protein
MSEVPLPALSSIAFTAGGMISGQQVPRVVLTGEHSGLDTLIGRLHDELEEAGEVLAQLETFLQPEHRIESGTCGIALQAGELAMLDEIHQALLTESARARGLRLRLVALKLAIVP